MKQCHMMFGDIISPVDVNINNIEFKMADKMADRVAKPANFSAENAYSLFNYVFCVYLFLYLIKASFYSLFK